jgi:bacterioferritin-associated ferredoxin
LTSINAAPPDAWMLAAINGAAAMIVCSCNVISDGEVRAVSGAKSPASPAQVYRGLGQRPQCGRCAGSIRKIMDETTSTLGVTLRD